MCGSPSETAIGVQVPTPPPSDVDDASDNLIPISTIFHPGAAHSKHPPDLILLSSDSVFFYVHSDKLLNASQNGFNSRLPVRHASRSNAVDGNPKLTLPESSHVMNIMLHAVYAISCTHFFLSFDCIAQAIASLRTYGFSLQTHIVPNLPLYDLILSRAPLNPIEFYTIAAENDLSELAVAISPHLLSYDLSNLTDELASKIGPRYLKRLFFLHLGRKSALKRLLRAPPALHGPTSDCTFERQKRLSTAWTLATAYFAWDSKPDLPTSTIQTDLGSLQDDLTCIHCKQALELRIKQLIVEWSNIKRTI